MARVCTVIVINNYLIVKVNQMSTQPSSQTARRTVRLPLPERFAIAQNALKRATAPIITLSDMDENEDFSPLDSLMERKKPEQCRWVEFFDDYRDAGKRWLKYNASIQYGSNRGTDTRWEVEGKYLTVMVQVQVFPRWDIDLIARLLISEIEGEIDYAVNY
jgi:hypothetical protein